MSALARTASSRVRTISSGPAARPSAATANTSSAWKFPGWVATFMRLNLACGLMTLFALIHGAGGAAAQWERVAAGLRERGHDAVAMDLPCEDDDAGLTEYADTVVEALGDRRDVVLVAHSLGGFTAPLVCDRVP